MTTTMFLSEVTVTGMDLQNPHLVLSIMDDEKYRQHQWLWRLFRSEEERKFLYRERISKQQIDLGVYQRSSLPSFYVLSSVPPEDRDRNVTVRTKKFMPKLLEGDKLFFELKANPVVRKKREGHKHSQKCDVLMDAKRHASDLETTWPAMEQSAKSWLVNQGKKRGFLVDSNSIAVRQYEQHLLTKRGVSKPIKFSSVDYQGVLSVTNPELFVTELGKGFGSSKAFGCGLMLIRRV